MRAANHVVSSLSEEEFNVVAIAVGLFIECVSDPLIIAFASCDLELRLYRLGHIERVISIAPVGVLAFPVVTGVNLVVTVSSVQFLYTLS